MFIQIKGHTSHTYRTKKNGFSKKRFSNGNSRPHEQGRFARGNKFAPQSFTDVSKFINKSTEVSTEQIYTPANTFDSFPIDNRLKVNIKNKGYVEPTPIQDQAIPPILEGRDVIGLASTGTGKTGAFLIPIINKILLDRTQKTLIIAPTRELATQIDDELYTLTFGMEITSALLIGGSGMQAQTNALRKSPHVTIATPGRLKDMLYRGEINFGHFKTFVLDEVDRMVDIGFIKDIEFFISLLPTIRQSLFFSATITPKISEILHKFVTDPVKISLKKRETSENVDQDVIRVKNRSQKIEHLHDLLIRDGFDKVLIFGRTKRNVEKLNRELVHRGFKVDSIHGNKSQGQRQRALDNFKNSQIQILLATDVASRGLDIENVTHVINYDLPQTYEDYIHRIGRTGRADKKGVALTFVE